MDVLSVGCRVIQHFIDFLSIDCKRLSNCLSSVRMSSELQASSFFAIFASSSMDPWNKAKAACMKRHFCAIFCVPAEVTDLKVKYSR